MISSGDFYNILKTTCIFFDDKFKNTLYLGSLDMLHGHYAGNAGSSYYVGDVHKNIGFSIPIRTDWVVICGSNLNRVGYLGVIVNGIINSAATGGTGNGALGINYQSTDTSDWQLSKVYIWDDYLSNSDFQLASESLYSELFSNTRDTGVCLPCQANSQSQAGANICGCNPGYTSIDGWRCTICPVNTFKTSIGNVLCTACGPNSNTNSQIGRATCMCNAGFYGEDGQQCTACPANSRSFIGNTICTCNTGFVMIGGTCTTCAAGYTGLLCTACSEGTFKEDTGSDSCTQCPLNKNSLVGSTIITDCFCNGATGRGNEVCLPCEARLDLSGSVDELEQMLAD